MQKHRPDRLVPSDEPALTATAAAGAGEASRYNVAARAARWSARIANAFLAAAVVAGAAGLIALAALPRASRFLPKLRLSPQAMPIH
jgi:hypothetical protein